MTTLTVGIPTPDSAIWEILVAQEKGWWEAAGLELELISANQPSLVQQLVSGSTQLAMVSADVGIMAMERGANLAYVSQPSRTSVFTLVAAPSVRTRADLRGQQIATNSLKGGSASMLRELLLRHGIQPDAYDFVPLGGTAERITALKAAQVAAAGVPPPRDLQIADEGYTVLGDTTELEPNWAGVATLVERRWAAEHTPTLTRFLQVQVAATNWLRDAANQEEAAAILARVTKVDLKYARALIASNLGERQMFSADARLQPATLEQVLKDLVAIGDMPALKPVATYTDPGYLERARTGAAAQPRS